MAARVSEPRIRVAAVIVIDDRLLLVRQVKTGAPYHLLPGGGVEPGESLAQALIREVAEETGVTARIVKPLFISDTLAPDGSRHVVNLTFLCEAVGVAAESPSERAIIGHDYATREALTTLDLRPPLARALADAWASDFEAPCRYLGPLWTSEPAEPDGVR